MIRIEYQNLNKLVNNHFNAIKNYFHRAGAREYTQTLYSKIDSYLVSNFKGHTFEYLIKANPIQLEEMRKEFDTNKPIRPIYCYGNVAGYKRRWLVSSKDNDYPKSYWGRVIC